MIATDVNFEKLKELKQERPTVEIDQLDVTKGTDVERMFKKYLDVNVLFNCAGCVYDCAYTLVRERERERERGRGGRDGYGEGWPPRKQVKYYLSEAAS